MSQLRQHKEVRTEVFWKEEADRLKEVHNNGRRREQLEKGLDTITTLREHYWTVWLISETHPYDRLFDDGVPAHKRCGRSAVNIENAVALEWSM